MTNLTFCFEGNSLDTPKSTKQSSTQDMDKDSKFLLISIIIWCAQMATNCVNKKRKKTPNAEDNREGSVGAHLYAICYSCSSFHLLHTHEI